MIDGKKVYLAYFCTENRINRNKFQVKVKLFCFGFFFWGGGGSHEEYKNVNFLGNHFGIVNFVDSNMFLFERFAVI